MKINFISSKTDSDETRTMRTTLFYDLYKISFSRDGSYIDSPE